MGEINVVIDLFEYFVSVDDLFDINVDGGGFIDYDVVMDFGDEVLIFLKEEV